MRLELAVLAVIALLFIGSALSGLMGSRDWAGSDDKAEGVISDITGGTYQPWTKPLWEPPSGEIESLLFSLQAAIGGIVIGYFLGYYRRGSRTDR